MHAPGQRGGLRVKDGCELGGAGGQHSAARQEHEAVGVGRIADLDEHAPHTSRERWDRSVSMGLHA